MEHPRSEASSEGPRPGDPASAGPRPPATLRDAGWAILAGSLLIVTAAQLIMLVLALTRLEVRLTTGGLILGFVITVVWLLTIGWLVLGSWRRSVWGCPFDHAAEASERRRCARHALITDEWRTPGDGT